MGKSGVRHMGEMGGWANKNTHTVVHNAVHELIGELGGLVAVVGGGEGLLELVGRPDVVLLPAHLVGHLPLTREVGVLRAERVLLRRHTKVLGGEVVELSGGLGEGAGSRAQAGAQQRRTRPQQWAARERACSEHRHRAESTVAMQGRSLKIGARFSRRT